ncbi:hypothetical protein FSARC_7681 [Fusarium sarcochroum]|uniref:Carboxylic ester hydrolase n=1 Tax=Fusarium sarcochroum TaxID=1208366 RepID=A0A8H4X728_9HYPO|nr:hypothetical protein FSARC_7681 [Fusarium sarcochroum]
MRLVNSLSFIEAGRALLGLPQAVLSPTHVTTSIPTVTVKNGTYAGVYSAQYDQDYFLGMRFAQPPERFSVAKGLNTSWDGARHVTEYPVHCHGYGEGWGQHKHAQSEDCLYLNLVRPAGINDTSGLPVAAWIHGGGLFMGGASSPLYNLSFIVEQSVALGTPVIGASFNYRLSALGFLTGREALREGVTNLGFHDQRLALRWINENIASFGGDPDKVTIFGESSGAESVAAQVFAYNGRDDGLFRAAVGESGFGGPLDRFPGGLNATRRMQTAYNALVANVTSCSNLVRSKKSLECLRKAPFEEIHHALSVSNVRPWPPVMDGDFIADYPTNQITNGRFPKIPILIGTNTDEGTFFGTGKRAQGAGVNTDDEMRENVATIFGPKAEKYTGKPVDKLVDELMELYPNDQNVGIPSLETWPHIIIPGDEYAKEFGAQYRRAGALFGDHAMHFQRRRANKAWATQGLPSYAYRFNISTNGKPPYVGVTHFEEVAFVFYNTNGDGYDVNPFGGDGTYPTDAKAMAKTITTGWINFFNTLDPNGKNGTKLFSGKEWPIYDLSDGPDGKGVVFSINGTHIEVDNWRSGGMEWFAEHSLAVFGN